MRLYYYENENLNKIIDDGVRDYCLCLHILVFPGSQGF
jgi:hypothetical protein